MCISILYAYLDINIWNKVYENIIKELKKENKKIIKLLKKKMRKWVKLWMKLILNRWIFNNGIWYKRIKINVWKGE